MKKNRIILVISLILFSLFWTTTNAQTAIDTSFQILKIQNVERVKNGFVIQMSDESEKVWFSVASLKKKSKKKNQKIEVGKTYKMKLIPYFIVDFVPDHANVFKIEIEGKNILIKSKSWTGNVYTTRYLQGLIYVVPETF